ncbi:MAG: zinc-ribbon domain containing protein [Deferrisomatales bacterium]
MYQDRTMKCRDCSADFVFTAGEQEFYAAKGFDNEPTRCKPCREARKGGGGGGGGGPKRGSYDARPRGQAFSVVCSDCGCQTEVPFQPTQDRPVYCKDCFSRRRTR